MADDLEFPALMTVEEAGKVLRRSPGVLRFMLRRGTIKGVHIGQRWFITADEVRRVIAEGTKPVELAGGRKHPGRLVEAEDQDQDQDRPAVDPDQLKLDLAKRGPAVDQSRRDPVRVRVIGDRGWQ